VLCGLCPPEEKKLKASLEAYYKPTKNLKDYGSHNVLIPITIPSTHNDSRRVAAVDGNGIDEQLTDK